MLTRGGTAQSVLEDAQLAFLVELGALVLELVDSEQDLRDDSVIDVDGTYRDYFERFGIAAVVNRPDFYVFGAVSQLSELGSLVDRLQTSLSAGGRRDDKRAIEPILSLIDRLEVSVGVLRLPLCGIDAAVRDTGTRVRRRNCRR